MLISTSRYSRKETKQSASNLFPFFGYEYIARVKKPLFKLFKIAESKGHFGVGILRDDMRLDVFSWKFEWCFVSSFEIKKVFKIRRKKCYVENIICSISKDDVILNAFMPNETNSGVIIKIHEKGVDVVDGKEKKLMQWKRLI